MSKGKNFVALFLIFSFVILPGNLMAQEMKTGEICLGGSLFFFEGDTALFGMICVGGNYKVVGFDLRGYITEGGAIIAGNLKLGLFDSQRSVPYATGGVWTTTGGGFGFNIGGGLGLRLTEVFAIRVEYRRWFVGEIDWGLNTISAGISWFF